jgi:UDP-N-acetylglucosamine 1-carboxyvinyltransferase
VAGALVTPAARRISGHTAQGRARMDSFLVHGGSRLKGKIEISGSKNSALPIMAACLLADGKTTLKSVPRLSDIDSMCKLIGELGCHIYRHEPTAGSSLAP